MGFFDDHDVKLDMRVQKNQNPPMYMDFIVILLKVFFYFTSPPRGPAARGN